MFPWNYTPVLAVLTQNPRQFAGFCGFAEMGWEQQQYTSFLASTLSAWHRFVVDGRQRWVNCHNEGFADGNHESAFCRLQNASLHRCWTGCWSPFVSLSSSSSRTIYVFETPSPWAFGLVIALRIHCIASCTHTQCDVMCCYYCSAGHIIFMRPLLSLDYYDVQWRYTLTRNTSKPSLV